MSVYLEHPGNGGRITLDNPPPGHYPIVSRHKTGQNSFSTDLRCSCGWYPGYKTIFKGDPEREKVVGVTKVSNEAPSRGGEAVARNRWLQHLQEEGF